MNRAIKIRIYPNNEQQIKLAGTFGCCRFVYNKMLEVQESRYKNGEPHLGKFDAFKYMTANLKPVYPFLKEADSLALMNSVFALDAGYDRFFKKLGGHPKFRSKHRGKASYTTNCVNGNIAIIDDKYIKLPKIGIIKAKVYRMPKDGWMLKSVTISRESDSNYYCSLLYEYEEDIIPIPHPKANAIGLDYKSDGLYVDSEGRVCGSPKYFRKAARKLAKAQKDLSRKKGSRKGETESNNHKKQKAKVARIHRHVANQRKDFLHKESTSIAKKYDLVCVEDLNMRAMSNKGFHNGKATLDNGYGMFLDMLEYKLRDRGKAFVKVDKFYPSSQLCSCCGHQNPAVKNLSMHKWTCPVCGTRHDRDINAAVNVRNEGLRIFMEGTA